MSCKIETYELTLLVNSTMSEQYSEIMAEVRSKIEEYGGQLTKSNNEGIKRLAYPIMGHERGLFVYCEIETKARDLLVKLSRWLNTYDPVFRYLIVPQDTRIKKGVRE